MHLLALFLLAAPAHPAATAATPPAAPAAAPADDSYPTGRGTVGVSFFLPAGGSDSRLVGATYFFADDVALRADLGLNLPITPSTGTVKLFSLAGGLRFVQLKRNHVMVYLQPGFGFGRELSPSVAAEGTWFVRFAAAAGVEYFFTPHFSAGAMLELSLKLANIGESAGNSIYTTLATDTSTLSVNIYF